MALVGVELETLVSEPDALTTRTPPCASEAKSIFFCFIIIEVMHLLLSRVTVLADSASSVKYNFCRILPNSVGAEVVPAIYYAN